MSFASHLHPVSGDRLIRFCLLICLLAGITACAPAARGRPTPPPPGTTAVPPTAAQETAPDNGTGPDTGIADDAPAAPLPEPSFEPQTATPVNPDGQITDGGNGVSIQLPTGALDAGETAVLEQSAIDPAWQQALEQDYNVDTPFVSLHAEGLNDSQGRATLRLPATSPDSRLVAVIDGIYLAALNIQPQDGALQAAVRLGPGDTSGVEQVGSLAPGGSLHYVVLTPKSTGGNGKGRWGKMAALDPLSCGMDIGHYTGRTTYCRQNTAGTVHVTYRGDIGFSSAQADTVANAMAAAIGRYAELGFTAAQLTPSAPMQVVVQSGSGDPYYKAINGTIYLPLDIAQSVSSGANHSLLHEMGHWIQDEAYNMSWAYWWGNQLWWLETAAENMVMLHDPAYIPHNMLTYGAIATDDNRLALQQSPYQWPTDFYVHATLVKLNMCDDTAVCPLSEKSFAAAISNGTFPYDSGDAKAKLSANLDAYAQYLLGSTPSRGNISLPLTGPVATQDRYGEYIEIRRSNNTDYRLAVGGYPPQMVQTSDERGEGVDIQATIGKDGVYPLIVSSGFNGSNPGLATALTIAPGAPFWYRLGGAAPVYHDGGTELVLQPIHLTLGHPSVRIAALGKNGGEQFAAKLRPIDLRGVWLIMPQTRTGGTIRCVDSEGNSDDTMDPETFPLLTTYSSLMGDFRPDAAGNGLTWEWNWGRVPADMAEYADTSFLFDGAVLPGAEDIKLQGGMEMKRLSDQGRQGPIWPPLLLGLTAVLPAAWGLKRGRKRPWAGVLGLVIAALLLGGCVVGIDIWGTVDSNMTFTQMEYVGGESVPVLSGDAMPEAPPIWRLNGTADYAVDFSVEVSSEDEEGNIVTDLARCTGSATYTVQGSIYPDVVLNFEE